MPIYSDNEISPDFYASPVSPEIEHNYYFLFFYPTYYWESTKKCNFQGACSLPIPVCNVHGFQLHVLLDFI